MIGVFFSLFHTSTAASSLLHSSSSLWHCATIFECFPNYHAISAHRGRRKSFLLGYIQNMINYYELYFNGLLRCGANSCGGFKMLINMFGYKCIKIYCKYSHSSGTIWKIVAYQRVLGVPKQAGLVGRPFQAFSLCLSEHRITKRLAQHLS